GWAMFDKLIGGSDGVFVMMRNSLKGWSLCDTKAGISEAVVACSSAMGVSRFPAVHGREILFFHERL
ncbi:unnamed protein product, partial [marine sediment metagenome]